jgi:glutathione S-transferase
MTLKLHAHPLSSYCWKVLIALYENDTPFEFAMLDFSDPQHAAAFAELWPISKMPVLEDRETGLVLPETSVIIEHLDHARPGATRFIPADWETAREARFWDRFYDNYVMTPMNTVVFNRLRPADHKDPFGVEQARKMLHTAYAFAEKAMADRTWAAGDAFTLADCAASPALHYADKVEPFRSTHPALAAYLARLEARPSFARALKEAEPYAAYFPQE